MKIALALWLLIACATPAHAGPIAAAISTIALAVTKFAASNVIAGFLVRTAVSIGLSALARALRPTAKREQPGIRTQTTTTGGTTPQKIILGRYATEGHLLAPPASYGEAGGTPNVYLVYVIALSVLPRATLHRVIVNDEFVSFEPTATAWGKAGLGKFAAVHVDYRDGTQTAAHPALLDALGTGPRPWSADMIGVGTCYAVCRFGYSREVFNGLPSVRFEMMGAPLYDPRFDSTVGGSGAQRWSDSGTWAQTENPAVMIYNILRGMRLADGSVWGGECAAEDLPLSNWMAAMNECDVAVAVGSSTEPQYRAGLEIATSDEPAAVINALLRCCSGQIAEVGGIYTIAVGAPALPVYFLTDEDILITRERHLDPFPGLTETFNGVTASYPDPDSLWESREAPPLYSSALEAQDGGRRLVADIQFTACSYDTQVRRMMDAYLADERRHRRHMVALPPAAAILTPLDTASWSSAENGYAGKLFEVTGLNDNLMTLIQSVQLRERDPSDYLPVAYAPTAPITLGPVEPTAQSVPGWAVSAASIADASGTPRRVKITMFWTPAALSDARGLFWEIRLASTLDLVLSGTASEISAGRQDVSEGLIPGESYKVRARPIVDRPADWSSTVTITTPALSLGTADLSGDAVSSTASVLTTGSIAVIGTAPVEAQALTFSTTGAPLSLTATVQIDASYLELALTVDGSAVAAWRVGALAVGAAWRPQSITLTARTPASAGSRTIKLMAAKYDAGDADASLSSRFLQVQELKR